MMVMANVPKHELKTWPIFFEAVWDGRKMFEIRCNDRNFQVEDILILREYDPTTLLYSGRTISARVDYIFEGNGSMGVQEGYVVMAITPWDKKIE